MRILLTSLLLMTSVAPPALAQSAAARFAGRPIEDIRLLTESTPTTDAALLGLIETRVGEALSIAAVRASIAHLYGLGRFQDVQVEAADAPGGGVALKFNLIPIHSIRQIEFAGDLRLSRGLLRRTVVERYGASPQLGRVDAAARTLQQLYQDNGYLRARVEAVPEIRHNPDQTVLTFNIDAGPRSTIGRLEIDGDPRVPRQQFLRSIDAAPGEPYLRPRLQERVEAYVRKLKERRFYEASGAVQATESEDGTKVDLLITIHPGLPVTVRFEGDPLPAERMTELAPLQREGSLDEDLLEDSETRIEGYLRQQGYWKADATVRREEANGALTVVFGVTKGRQYRVAGAPALTGAQAIPVASLVALVPLKPGDLFVEAQLSAGASAIQELYRQRGFAAVEVKTAIQETDPTRAGEGLVQPLITIVEGARTVVGDVVIRGNESIPIGELRPLVAIKAGDVYYEPEAVKGREALVLEYLNRGFASVVVSAEPQMSEDRTSVSLVFAVQEGPQTIVDHILIVGNVHTDADVILRELQFRSGQPLGLQDQFESRRRLSALGLFRRVRITELTHGAGTEHDVLITVEEAPATSIGYGGGVEATQRLRSTGPEGQAEEQLEFAPRGFFEIGRRNLFGANRSASLYGRVSLRPRDAPDDPELDGTGLEFSEYRLVGTYLQPRFFGPNNLSVAAVIEQGVRSTYNFARRGVNVDVVRRLTAAIRVSARYSLSTTRTFDERLSDEDQATIDRLFPRVLLSGFSGAVARDTRDDLLAPTRGLFVSSEASIAARALGSQVGFMKTYVQGFTFRRLPGRRAVVLATRGAIGVADGFERVVEPTDPEGNPLPVPPVVVEDLPASERFFAGGDTTIRGYALDSVGAPNTISPNGFPTGGNAVVLLNSELRVPVWKDFGAVLFVDGGNVFRRVTEIDFGELRGSVGFGLRYQSPIGPIRVDLGFKMDRREIQNRLEPRTALHFSLGQAF